MICLKNRTFAVSQTTEYPEIFKVCKLWFAWKIVLLQYRKQHFTISRQPANRCDLLEKSYFCSIANNGIFGIGSVKTVVICLKNRTFAVSQTTSNKANTVTTSCDLLEKSYFCSIANNKGQKIKNNIAVVICLKNRTFAVSQTTAQGWHTSAGQLWFAWKIVLLQYRKQPVVS